MDRGATHRARSRGAACTAMLLCMLASAGRGAAEPSADDKALATVLFRQGRTLMDERRVPEACLKLEESHRLDPGGGTILNLALCHEQEGKLARSWSEFNEALAFARRDRRADREAEAREHASMLEPRLSRLTIVVPDGARVEGLRVECDGRELAPASWALAMPVDGGEHDVQATAPGHEPFTARITVPGERGASTIEVPSLSLAAAVTPPPAPSLPPPPTAAPAPSLVAAAHAPPARGARRTAAWVVGAAGLAQLGLAGYFGLRAIDLQAQGNPDDYAGRAADRSTVLFVTGVATTGVATYLLLTSPRKAVAATDAETTPTARLAVSAQGATIELSGRF